MNAVRWGVVPAGLTFLKGPISPVSAPSARQISRQWTGRLAHYRLHDNDEHREALISEALRFTGLHLENELSSSPYWSRVPLARRVALLLFLVDRGVVSRAVRQGRVAFEASEDAVAWVASQPSLASYLAPSLEFLASIHACHSRPSRS